MKAIYRVRRNLAQLVTIALVLAIISGCSGESPYAPSDVHDRAAALSLKYDQTRRAFAGGEMRLRRGITFRVPEGSCTPADSVQNADGIPLTMSVDETSEQDRLDFDFGPDGTTFADPAVLTMSWGLLDNSEYIRFYYINESGEFEEQEEPEIDRAANLVIFRVHHFSRYAIVHSK